MCKGVCEGVCEGGESLITPVPHLHGARSFTRGCEGESARPCDAILDSNFCRRLPRAACFDYADHICCPPAGYVACLSHEESDTCVNAQPTYRGLQGASLIFIFNVSPRFSSSLTQKTPKREQRKGAPSRLITRAGSHIFHGGLSLPLFWMRLPSDSLSTQTPST